MTPEARRALTPDGVLEKLLAGNARFAAGQSRVQDLRSQVDSNADGQYPLVAVLSCMDSRIVTEVIFDQGLGDVFSIRVAGNVASRTQIGSMEFACCVVGTKLIVVLGHTRCGAVTAAIDMVAEGGGPEELTHLDAVTGPIVQSVHAETETVDDRTGKNAAFVDRVAALNVGLTMKTIRESSGALRERLDAGSIRLVGALYDITTGRVELIEPQ